MSGRCFQFKNYNGRIIHMAVSVIISIIIILSMPACSQKGKNSGSSGPQNPAEVIPVITVQPASQTVTEGSTVEMRMLLNREIDIIVFTSSAEIFSLLDQLKEKRTILNNVVTAYMGKFTSKTGTIVKLRQDIVPEKYTMQDLLEAMEAYFRK